MFRELLVLRHSCPPGTNYPGAEPHVDFTGGLAADTSARVQGVYPRHRGADGELPASLVLPSGDAGRVQGKGVPFPNPMQEPGRQPRGLPRTSEKEVERFRYSTINSLLTRRDVIVVATVSAIYGSSSVLWKVLYPNFLSTTHCISGASPP